MLREEQRKQRPRTSLPVIPAPGPGDLFLEPYTVCICISMGMGDFISQGLPLALIAHQCCLQPRSRRQHRPRSTARAPQLTCFPSQGVYRESADVVWQEGADGRSNQHSFLRSKSLSLNHLRTSRPDPEPDTHICSVCDERMDIVRLLLLNGETWSSES